MALNVMDAIETISNVSGAISVYGTEKEKGHGVARSLATAAADFAFYEMLGPWAMPLVALQMGAVGAQTAHQMGYENAAISKRAHKSNFGGNFQDSQMGATMRMRGLQAMQQSQLQGYTTLGNEARRYL